MTAPTPAGWYPDPSGMPRLRYFDGRMWTEHYSPQARLPVPQQNKRAVWPWIVGGVVALLGVLFLVGLAAEGGSKDKTHPSASATSSVAPKKPTSAQPATPSTAAPEGSAVRDGKFEFRVINVTRSKTVSDPTGNPYMTTTAQGEFVVVTLSVQNIGDEARSFYGTNQKLIDVSGRQYDANSAASLWMNPGTGDINPGNAIQARVAFDVPPGTETRELILHDSMFSGGAHLSLSAP